MAVQAMVRRVINLYNTNSVKAQAVNTDILNAVRAYNPVTEVSQDSNTLTLSFLLTSAQDTALQGLMAGFASRLGVAQIDTHSVAVNQGHP